MPARGDYILGIYQRGFKMVVIRGIRKYPSYHFALRDRIIIYTIEAG